ncbi:MAG: nicotinate (nicotinamide) nucleotide adenylyltransferase [Bradymonadia bacterium]
MARVAVYGGAFNPPHLAHVFTVSALLSRSDVDEVWVMPAYGHVFGKHMAAFEERVEMLQATFEGFGGAPVKISEFEGERKGISRTYDTLEALEHAHPEHAFMWVMGADNLTESHRWHRFDELVARWQVIVFGRPGHEAALQHFAQAPWCLPGPVLTGISSTLLRNALASGGPEETLRWLPPQIRQQAQEIYGRLASPPEVGPVAIFGAGRAGLALATALRAAGVEVPVVWNRTLRAGATHSGPLASHMSAMLQAPVWILAVTDEAIETVAHQIAVAAGERLHHTTVMHCAGRLGREALHPLAAHARALGSVHPVQTLHGVTGAVEALEGAWCAVEGDEDAVGIGRNLVAAWSGEAVHIPQGGKGAWHAAAVLAGNGIGALMAGGVALLRALGLDDAAARGVLSPLQEGTVEALAQGPVHRHLTGPVSRGDIAAIADHMAALSARCPDWIPLYREVVMATARAMQLPPDQVADFEEALASE